MRRLTAILCIAAAAPTLARADEEANIARSKAIWREGVIQYDLGQFDAAIKKLEEAYEIYPFPNILFSLGQAHRKIKSYEKAIHYFRSYLRYNPQASNRSDTEAIIKELDRLVAEQKASNERPPDTLHVPSPAPASTTPTKPAPPPAPVEQQRWYQDPVALSLAGAGVVGIGLGTAFLIHSSGLSSDAGAEHDQIKAQSLHDSAGTFGLAGGITLGVGTALLAGGVVKMLLHNHASQETKVSVALGLHGFAIAGSF